MLCRELFALDAKKLKRFKSQGSFAKNNVSIVRIVTIILPSIMKAQKKETSRNS